MSVDPMYDTLVEKIEHMEVKVDKILEKLGKGDVSFATILLRVQMLERIVYGAVGLSLLSLGGAILSLVTDNG